jgi:hypothetical protein
MPAALRVRTRWFRDERVRAPGDIASAVAAGAWRIARHAIARMRNAGFDIDAGEAYFAFLAEFLAFEVAIADRIAYMRLAADARIDFTGALARRIGAMLDDSASELLAVASASWYERFIDLVNARNADYAHFACTGDGPEFGFLRAFGTCLTGIVPAKDRPWTMAQVVEIEAPEAVATLVSAMRSLLPAP